MSVARQEQPASVCADARLDPAVYDRDVSLTVEERSALEALAGLWGRCPREPRWPDGARAALTRLRAPIDDVLFLLADSQRWAHWPARFALLMAMRAQDEAFWGWDRDTWVTVLRGSNKDVRQHVMAVAYLLCGFRDLHREVRGFRCGRFARRVFGIEPVDRAVGRVQAHLDGLGHAVLLQRPNLQGALYDLMLVVGSPLLEDLAACGELLAEAQSREQNNARRYGVEQLARTLVAMGVLESLPFGGTVTREEWLERSRAGDGVPGEWLGWVRRWFLTSTLSRNGRQRMYYMLIKAGRWLAAEHPDRADPRSWTRELAAAWVAAVDQMIVGDFSRAPNTDAFRAGRGGPLSARSKSQHISMLGAFFCDLQEWEWIERRFDPRRAFAVPRSIRALIGPDPRVIADDIWAKLLWAGLNLTEPDLPVHANANTGRPWYPLELVRAVAMLWLFGGLRVDEILRLRLGAVRWQHQHADGDENARAVCLLDVPTNKTGTAFTKPVDRTVGEAIEAWEAVRPAQPAFTDRKTGETVQLLFAYRGAPLGKAYVNRVLIPLLCRKAGVPTEDVRGRITGHRARATIATQLYNAKEPMSLFELQAWLGHRWVGSTQHYARITPTTLAKAYTEAGYFARNLRAIEVLLDRDAIQHGTAGGGQPFEYYDLGHGYCTYSFFEQCPHRMACARCDFYLPKASSEMQLLEAKQGLQRMLVEIPLTDDERAAVEGDQNAVGRLIDLLADTPTPAGPTPRALDDTSHEPVMPAPRDLDVVPADARCAAPAPDPRDGA